MRSHRQIIDDAGGASALAAEVFPHLPTGRWSDARALANTVQAWKRQAGGKGSIPSEYWAILSAQKVASLDELAAGAAQRLGEAAA